MALPEDFRDHVYAFNCAGAMDVTFLRWTGNTTFIAGTAVDDGYVPLALSPQWVFVPRIPKDEIERLEVGDRQRSGCLVWSITTNGLGTDYDTLRTIEQVGQTRPDRIVDVDRGLTYEVATQWTYGRQALVAGAIGLLINV